MKRTEIIKDEPTRKCLDRIIHELNLAEGPLAASSLLSTADPGADPTKMSGGFGAQSFTEATIANGTDYEEIEFHVPAPGAIVTLSAAIQFSAISAAGYRGLRFLWTVRSSDGLGTATETTDAAGNENSALLTTVASSSYANLAHRRTRELPPGRHKITVQVVHSTTGANCSYNWDLQMKLRTKSEPINVG